ncbi:861_t:CDS:2, partial [Funneliformis mosseae]
NAKSEFQKCDNGRFSTPLLSVTLHPDPVVSGKLATFNVSGTIPTKITENTAIIAYYYDLEFKRIVGDHHLERICKGTECSIEANTQFTKKFKFLTPPLPFQYLLKVAVLVWKKFAWSTLTISKEYFFVSILLVKNTKKMSCILQNLKRDNSDLIEAFFKKPILVTDYSVTTKAFVKMDFGRWRIQLSFNSYFTVTKVVVLDFAFTESLISESVVGSIGSDNNINDIDIATEVDINTSTILIFDSELTTLGSTDRNEYFVIDTINASESLSECPILDINNSSIQCYSSYSER